SYSLRHPPTFTLFPYTTLFRSKPVPEILLEQYAHFDQLGAAIEQLGQRYTARKRATNAMDFDDLLVLWLKLLQEQEEVREQYQRDRKSTRLNSSHVAISYAVFC